MKINISFDWAVLTSIFTFFLYWCGYWYLTGYLEFYSFNLDAFDIPVVSTILQGILTGYKAWIWLIIILCIFSYITHTSSKQWQYWLVKGICLLINFFIILFNLSIYYFIKYAKRKHIVQNSIRIIETKTPLLIKKFFNFCILFLKKTLTKVSKKSKKIEVINNDILTKLSLITPQIKQDVFGDDQNPSTNQNFQFDFAFFLHYAILVLLLAGIVKVFNTGQFLVDEGKSRAHEQFLATKQALKNDPYKKNSLGYPKVRISESKSDENLFLTSICLKSQCLITDEFKNVQVYEVKQIRIINELKKVP